MCQQFRLKNIVATINYFAKRIEQNKLMRMKNKKVCMTLNYIEHILALDSTVTGCIQFLLCFLSGYYYRNYKFC